MDWNEKFKNAINSIYSESNFTKLGIELFSLTEFYVKNENSGFEAEFDKALADSEIMKQHFFNFGHPSPVSASKIEPKIGEKVDYETLQAVALAENDKNYDKTVVVCLRHFL